MKEIFLQVTKLSVCFLALSTIVVSCNNDDTDEYPPFTPGTERHLRLSAYAGNDNDTARASWTDSDNGKLTFGWDYSEADATKSDLKMAFIKNGKCLKTTDGNKVTDARILQHTDTEKAEDRHWAELETIEGFNPNMPNSAYEGNTIHAITPINDINNSTVGVGDNGTFTATLNMPTTFTQSGKNNLGHLSDYTYMYANGVLSDYTALLNFDHLAAYLRFKVYNWRGEPATLYGVRMEVVDAESKAASASGISAAYTANGFIYTAASADAGVHVNIADEGLLFDDRVFLYAPVLPVGSENAFKDKTLRFTLIADDPIHEELPGEYEYFTYELDDYTFKSVTGSYDWIPGDLYTFHLYLDDVLKVPEVTVNDWIEKDINGGEAEEN